MISLDIISSADAADQIIDVETRESDFWIEYNKKFVITQSEDFSIDFFQRKSLSKDVHSYIKYLEMLNE